MSIKSKLQDWLFTAKTGIRTETLNGGKPVDEIVIRYKNLYFGITVDVETGEPTGDFNWADNESVFHVPVREMYVARKPR